MGVKLDRVTKTFGRLVAVSDFSCDVATGEFVTIVGPSGCGKTTTLRMIAGFIQPDHGEIYIDGQLMNPIPTRFRNIGIVFQNYALFPNMTAYENIAYGLRVRKVPEKEIKNKVAEMLELTGLSGMENKYPRQLSGGQQQRVALARALIFKPRVLLLDEPLSALDAKVRLHLRYEMKRIQREFNITTIYVTHDQEEALSISDRVIVMNNGTIQQIGAPIEIYNAPGNRFVADFIGIANIIEGRISPGRKDIFLFEDREIKIVPQEHVNTGEKVYLAIRPENIKIHTEAPKTGEEQINVLKGNVSGITFLGPTARVKVEAAGKSFLVDIPNFESGRLKGGEEVYITFGSEAPRIIKE